MVGPRKVDKPLVLYGYGKLGHLAEEIFNKLGIPVYAIMDSKMPHLKILDGGAEHFRPECLLAICVAREPYNPIKEYLSKAGWTDIVPIWDIVEAYPEIGIHNGWFAGKMRKGENRKIVEVYCNFEDKKSQEHYDAFMEWHIDRSEVKFPLNISLKKPTLPSTLADIEHRRRVDMFADSPMNNITIHNEGCELKTLEKNIHLFKKYRPEICVACYHSRDGLWKIPKFLMDNLKDYEFKFRLHAYMGQGAYIYCTPKERIGK